MNVQLIAAGRWEVCGATVRGASHERTGRPNQDALKCVVAHQDVRTWATVAVADGHGSAVSFRSDKGSRLAVESASRCLADFASGYAGSPDLAAIGRAASLDLPQVIVRCWQRAVDDELAAMPFADNEVAALAANERAMVQASPRVAFGSTLLAALVTGNWIVYLHLGDGDILVVSEDRKVGRPLPPDPRLMGNETTSLCASSRRGRPLRPAADSLDAWADFRVRLVPLVFESPALVLLSTDGYANSFSSDAAFLRVGSDLLDMIRGHSLAVVQRQLEGWLSEASGQGSGDDVTLGLIHHLPATRHAGAAGSGTGEAADAAGNLNAESEAGR